ncbi:MAG: hypothetical protein H0W67_07665, partial [Gemmatimonadales bacterium]|nr:hypothetical protein [Gemmatimonadales bacterium]
REARLKAELAYVYPEIDPDTWHPVELLLRQVAAMLYGDPAKGSVISGERLLRDDHFDFRGQSPRPEGLPTEASRLSDSGADPRRTRPRSR